MEQVDAAEDVARNEWNRVWREEYRTPPAADWVRWMLDELLIQLPPEDFNALADYFDRLLLDADPGPTLIDGAAETVRRLAQHYKFGVISDSGLLDRQDAAPLSQARWPPRLLHLHYLLR